MIAKKPTLFHHLLLLLGLCFFFSVLVGSHSVNPWFDDDTKDPPDDDDCIAFREVFGGGAGNECVSVNIHIGAARHEGNLTRGVLRIFEESPSSALSTPATLLYSFPLDTEILSVLTSGLPQGVDRRVRIRRPNRKVLAFDFEQGESWGYPIHTAEFKSGAQRKERLRMTNAQGDPVTSNPTYYEQHLGDGRFVRFGASSYEALAYVTETGREIEPTDPTASGYDSVGVTIIRDGDNLRQIKTARNFVDIVTDGPYKYEIKVYEPHLSGTFNQGTGLFLPDPNNWHTRWTIENPDASPTQFDRLWVTRTIGQRDFRTEYEYDHGADQWTMIQGDEFDVVRTDMRSYQMIEPNRVYTQEVEIYTPEDGYQTVSKKEEFFTWYNWGYEVTKETIDPGGLDLVTEFAYYTNASQQGRYGRMRWRKNPDDSWELYDYDSEGRLVSIKRPWKDQAFSTNPATYQETVFVYPNVTAGSYERRPEERIEIVNDGSQTVTVGRTHYRYEFVGGEYVATVEVCVNPNANYGDSSNLKTVRTYYSATAGSLSAGRLKSIEYPDGRLDDYSYALDGQDNLRRIVFHGSTDSQFGLSNKTTRRVSIIDDRGYEIVTETDVFTGGSSFESIETIERTFNAWSELTEIKRDGRVTYDAVWIEGLKDSVTDEVGVKTTFTYDALDRVKTGTREGVSAQGSYPAQPDIVTTHVYDTAEGGGGCGTCNADSRIISADGLNQELFVRNDKAGREVERRGPDGLSTTTVYNLGGRERVRTLPNGSQVTTVFYRDGRLKSITGAAVVNQYFDYSVESNGTKVTEITFGSLTSDRWTRITTDAARRTVKEESPSFTGTKVTEYFYDDGAGGTGLLEKITKPGRADTLFDYDGLARLFRTGLDIGNTGSLDLGSNDRITETEVEYGNSGGSWFRVETTRAYHQPNSSATVELQVNKQQLTGFSGDVVSRRIVEDPHGNETITTREIDRSAGLLTETVNVPGSNLDQIRIVRNGLLQSVRGTTFNAETTFQYDALGREVGVTDPRTGQAETTYETWQADSLTWTSNRVVEQKDAASNITTFTYYPADNGSAPHENAGLLQSRTNPENETTRFAYDAAGRNTHVWGEAEYPVLYIFDDFGQLAEQRTYRDEHGWGGSTWPNVSGNDADITKWHYHEGSGLLEEKEYADSEKTAYTYYTSGEVATRTWARMIGASPVVTTYTYWDDEGGELKKVEYSDDTPDVEYTYTRTGQPHEVTDVVGTRTFGYTAELELETEDIDGSGGGLYSFLFTRKHQGGGSGQVPGRPGGVSVGTSGNPTANYNATWNYNAQGRLSSVYGPGLSSFGAHYAYLADSNHVETVYYLTSSTSAATRTYTHLSDRNLVETVDNKHHSTTISNYAYEYDAVGRRENVVNTGSAFSQNAHNVFAYNDRGEVIESKRFLGTNPQSPGSEVTPQRRLYDFDAIGNRESHTSGTGSPVSYTANELNQYTDIGSEDVVHDKDGNLTAILDGSDTKTYKWDAENRLVFYEYDWGSSISEIVTFRYDYMGRRVERTTWEGSNGEPSTLVKRERYVWDEWNLLMVLDDQNNIVRKFTWGLDIVEQATGLPRNDRPGRAAGGVGGLLAVEEISGSEAGDYVFFYDANGNVVQALDWSNGTIKAHYEYDPFGSLTRTTGSYRNINSFRFSTKYWDSDTELLYYGFRFYSPGQGRFLNRDPIEEQGGLNLHATSWNDLINRFDYLGLVTLEEFNAYMDAMNASDRTPQARDIYRIPGEDGKSPLQEWWDDGLERLRCGWDDYLQDQKDLFRDPERIIDRFQDTAIP